MPDPTIDVDWSEEGIHDLFDLSCPKGDSDYHEKLRDKGEYCDSCEDNSGYIAPMMNYIWKLDVNYNTFDSEKHVRLRKKVDEWCGPIAVIEGTGGSFDGDCYLALCGGGMDLSPYLALAYAIYNTWIPQELLASLRMDYCKILLGSNTKKFKYLKRAVRASLKKDMYHAKAKLKEWTEHKEKKPEAKKVEKKKKPR